jgi:hypothetical protein
MKDQCKYWDIIDRDHLEASVIYSKRQIAFGITMGPNSFKDGKMTNFVVWLDFLLWCLEIQIKFDRR